MSFVVRFLVRTVVACAVACSGDSIGGGNENRGGSGGAAGNGNASGGGTAGSSSGGSVARGGASGESGASGAAGEGVCPGDTQEGCPPLVDAGADRTVPCTAPEGASVELAGSALDRDGIETVAWTRQGETLGMSLNLVVTAPLGESEFVLTARDITGDIGSDTVVIRVADTEPPALAVPDLNLVICECHSFTPPEPEMLDCRPEALTATNPIAIGSSREAPPYDVPEPFPLTLCPGDSFLVRWTLSDGENTTEADQLIETRGPQTQAELDACN